MSGHYRIAASDVLTLLNCYPLTAHCSRYVGSLGPKASITLALKEIRTGAPNRRRVSKQKREESAGSQRNLDNLKSSAVDIPIDAPIPAPIPAAKLSEEGLKMGVGNYRWLNVLSCEGNSDCASLSSTPMTIHHSEGYFDELRRIPIDAPIPAPVPAVELLEEQSLKTHVSNRVSNLFSCEENSDYVSSSTDPISSYHPESYFNDSHQRTSTVSCNFLFKPDLKKQVTFKTPFSLSPEESCQQSNKINGLWHDSNPSNKSVLLDETEFNPKHLSNLTNNSSHHMSKASSFTFTTPPNWKLPIKDDNFTSKQNADVLQEQYSKSFLSCDSIEVTSTFRSSCIIDGAESLESSSLPGSAKKRVKFGHQDRASCEVLGDVKSNHTQNSSFETTVSLKGQNSTPSCSTPKRHFSEIYDDQRESYLYEPSTTDQTPYSPLIHSPRLQYFRPANKSYLPQYNAQELQSLSFDVGFIDSHCHLDFLYKRTQHNGSFKAYQKTFKETFPVSYEGCVAVFCDPFTFVQDHLWRQIIEEDGIWATFGCHPHNAYDYNNEIHSSLVRVLKHHKVKALGEIGLDYSNRNKCAKAVQHQVFKRQLKLAVEEQLPLVIHNRGAFEDCLDILKKYLPRDYKIHLHCCTDSWEDAKIWLNTFPNLYIGLTNVITYASAENVHNTARNIPLDRLLLETDSPYFLPRSLPRRLKWSHPGMAIHVAAQVAALKNISLEEILKAVRQNTKCMYGI